ncbi:MAG TPA: hypothetical protein VFV27_10665, partial [Nevskiaceae bacterium]|nr:hypothetical protein [Nevskiaceae bacterium]
MLLQRLVTQVLPRELDQAVRRRHSALRRGSHGELLYFCPPEHREDPGLAQAIQRHQRRVLIAGIIDAAIGGALMLALAWWLLPA